MRRQAKRPRVVPLFDSLEARQLLSADAGTAATALGAPRPAGSPVLVAVVDSGIDVNASDPTHYTGNPALIDFTDAYNAVSGTYGQAAVADPVANSQGTRTANYVAKGIADAQFAGGNPNVEIVPIKTFDKPGDGTPFYALINGIYHAIDIGVKVIDLGFSASNDVLDASEVQQLQAALQDASTSGIVVTVAAGDTVNPNGSPGGISLDQSWGYVPMFPAIFHQSDMLVTAATDSSGNPSAGANYGAIHVDVGVSIPLADRVSAFASAYASGVAVVEAASRPDWTAVQLVNHLKQTVVPTPGLAGKVTSGGMLSATKALNGVYGVVATRTPGALDGGVRSDFTLYGNFAGSGYTFQAASASQGFETAYPTIINNNGYGVGGPGSIPVPGDYYSKGVTNPAIYGPEFGPNGQPTGKYDLAILSQGANGQYAVTTFVQGVGGPNDIPVAANFSGSGKDDFALYGVHNGQYNFEVLTAASNFNLAQVTYLDNNGYGFGGPGSIPVVGDFFGDGKADPAIYGPQIGANGQPTGVYNFAALDTGSINAQGYYTRSLSRQGFQAAGAIPIVGDYTGDGVDDLALYGDIYNKYQFVVLTSNSGFDVNNPTYLNNNGYGFGAQGSVPVVGDFDGDGAIDPAIYGPQIGANGQPNGLYNFAYLSSSSHDTQGHLVANFGAWNTIPTSTSPFIRWYEAHFT